jgi:hypothetical protein
MNWELDNDAISKDEMFDGYYAILPSWKNTWTYAKGE